METRMKQKNLVAYVLSFAMLTIGIVSYANKAIVLFTSEEAKHLDFGDKEIPVEREFSLSR